MNPSDHPVTLTVRGRQFYAALRRLRDARGMSQAEAADALRMSRQRYGRLETGVVRFKAGELESMLDLFGCAQALRLALLELARHLNSRGLWTTYDDVLEGGYAEIEGNATDIRTHQTLLVPGLLQTPEYTIALARIWQSDEETQMRQVAARAARRRHLMSTEGPSFHAIIAESVLHKPIGGREVLSEQLRSLVVAASRPNVLIQVIPTEVWDHPGHEGSFVIFGFGGPSQLDVAYFEGVAGSNVYLEAVYQVEPCSVNFERISKAALSGEESVALIKGLLG